MSKYIRDLGSCNRNSLIGDIGYPLVTTTVELEGSQGVLRRGAILGKITASGKYKLVKTDAGDGSEKANCVLAHDVDASEAGATATCYVSGNFNLNRVYIEDNTNLLNCLEDLRNGNIYISMEV